MSVLRMDNQMLHMVRDSYFGSIISYFVIVTKVFLESQNDSFCHIEPYVESHFHFPTGLYLFSFPHYIVSSNCSGGFQ